MENLNYNTDHIYMSDKKSNSHQAILDKFPNSSVNYDKMPITSKIIANSVIAKLKQQLHGDETNYRCKNSASYP